ncbi:MAG: MgtC/SapB family protein [Candidatus Micrarchaeota archaeon]
MLTESDMFLRMIAAALIGLLIGISRKKKVAGARTFSLFCLGCTIFTIIAISDVFGPGSVTDQTRILGQIVTGIGFLGLGVIWKQGAKPTGLTTAAAIWVTAGVGMLVGLGMWTEVAASSAITLVIILSRGVFEKLGFEG